jgi:hypothetical protein
MSQFESQQQRPRPWLDWMQPANCTNPNCNKPSSEEQTYFSQKHYLCNHCYRVYTGHRRLVRHWEGLARERELEMAPRAQRVTLPSGLQDRARFTDEIQVRGCRGRGGRGRLPGHTPH